MENIDEFMRHKFNNEEPDGRFEFREEFWEQAKALIELDEANRKKNRRWLFFWWVSGLILLAGAWGFWQTGAELFRDNSRQESAVIVAASEHPAVSSDLLNHGLNHDGNSAAPLQNKSAKTQNSSLRHSSNMLDKNNNSTTSTPLRNTQDLKEVKPSFNTERPTGNANKKRGNDLLILAQKAPLGTVLPDLTKKSSLEGTLPEAAKPDLELTEIESPIPASVANDGLRTDNLSSNMFSSIPTAATLKSEQVAKQIAVFDPLSVPIQPIAYKKDQLQPFFDTEIVQPAPVKVLKDKRFSVGVEAFTSVFVFDQNPLKWGGGAGLFTEFGFQKHWSATGGLRYRFIPKAADTQVISQEDYTSLVRYSFGAQYIEQKRDITAFHLIELPLGLQWRAGRFALNAFGAPGIVLGALGQVTNSSTSSLSFTQNYINSQRDIYFSSDVYRRISMSVGTGVAWQAFSGLSFYAQFQYYGSLSKPASDGTKEKGFENISAGIKYKF